LFPTTWTVRSGHSSDLTVVLRVITRRMNSALFSKLGIRVAVARCAAVSDSSFACPVDPGRPQFLDDLFHGCFIGPLGLRRSDQGRGASASAPAARVRCAIVHGSFRFGFTRGGFCSLQRLRSCLRPATGTSIAKMGAVAAANSAAMASAGASSLAWFRARRRWVAAPSETRQHARGGGRPGDIEIVVRGLDRGLLQVVSARRRRAASRISSRAKRAPTP